MTLRAALVGCGRIGSLWADDARIRSVNTHAGAYRRCQATRLDAVCDVNPARAIQAARRWRVPQSFTDVDEMLSAANPELVSVCTPDATHYEILRRVLGYPSVRGVLAEKPLALTVPQGRALVKLADAAGKTLAVNYGRRYAPSHWRIRQQIDEGRIGKLQRVGGFYTKGILHNGTHWLDLARFFAGEIESVQATSPAAVVGPDPALDATILFASGTRGFLAACDPNSFTLFEMDLVGTKGRVRVVDSGHRIESYQVGESEHASGHKSLVATRSPPGGFKDLILRAVDDLASAVKSGRPPRCTGEDGLAALSAAHAIIQSARQGRPVPVRRPP